MNELEKEMYYGASQITFDKARKLRIQQTLQEAKLWDRLKGKQISGFRFRRQHPVETFIVDFYCHPAKLVVEVDGKIHIKNQECDRQRSTELEKYGILVLRFSNDEIDMKIEEVVKRIEEQVLSRIQN